MYIGPLGDVDNFVRPPDENRACSVKILVCDIRDLVSAACKIMNAPTPRPQDTAGSSRRFKLQSPVIGASVVHRMKSIFPTIYLTWA